MMEVVSSSSSLTNPFDDCVREWSDVEIKVVLRYLREWNTNAKHALVAQVGDLLVMKMLRLVEVVGVSIDALPHFGQQTLFNSLIRTVKQERLAECSREDPSVISGLLPYTERHFARVDKLIQASYLIDFTLSSMQILLPPGEAEEIDKEAEQGKGGMKDALLWGRGGDDDESDDEASFSSSSGHENGNGILVGEEDGDDHGRDEDEPDSGEEEVMTKVGKKKDHPPSTTSSSKATNSKRGKDKDLDKSTSGTTRNSQRASVAPSDGQKKKRKNPA